MPCSGKLLFVEKTSSCFHIQRIFLVLSFFFIFFTSAAFIICLFLLEYRIDSESSQDQIVLLMVFFGHFYKYNNCKVFATIFQNVISLMHAKNCHMIQTLLLRNVYLASENEARFIFHLTFFACFFADFVSVMLLSDCATREIQKYEIKTKSISSKFSILFNFLSISNNAN